MKETSGYGILPRTESLHTVSTCMLYLPRDDALSPFGTALLQPKDAEKKCLGVGNPLYPRDDFNIVTRLKFKPNSLVPFVKTPTSCHSLPPLPILPYDRSNLTLLVTNHSRISDDGFHQRLSNGNTNVKGWGLWVKKLGDDICGIPQFVY